MVPFSKVGESETVATTSCTNPDIIFEFKKIAIHSIDMSDFSIDILSNMREFEYD